jgi:hypothetical protein
VPAFAPALTGAANLRVQKCNQDQIWESNVQRLIQSVLPRRAHAVCLFDARSILMKFEGFLCAPKRFEYVRGRTRLSDKPSRPSITTGAGFNAITLRVC